jgi:AcrR family transcriptional regulator
MGEAAMPRAGLSTKAVVDIAIEIIDTQGQGALALSSVAARAGVASASLYKHVGSLGELRAMVAARILGEMTEAATSAVIGLSGDAAIAALMWRMRQYALEHPTRYLAVPADPVHDPALAEPANRFLGVFLAVLRSYHLEGSAAIHAVRLLRVTIHGFASIESSGGFGLTEDPAETYEKLIQMYLATLPRQ